MKKTIRKWKKKRYTDDKTSNDPEPRVKINSVL